MQGKVTKSGGEERSAPERRGGANRYQGRPAVVRKKITADAGSLSKPTIGSHFAQRNLPEEDGLGDGKSISISTGIWGPQLGSEGALLDRDINRALM